MLRIHPSEFRGEVGFTVSGTHPTNKKRLSIFCKTERTARLVRDAIRFGQSEDRIAHILNSERETTQ